MYYNGTIKPKAEAEKEITAYANMRKRVAALCRNSDIHAAFRQFNGKVINKRFDEALKAASVKADGGNEERFRTLRLHRASAERSVLIGRRRTTAVAHISRYLGMASAAMRSSR